VWRGRLTREGSLRAGAARSLMLWRIGGSTASCVEVDVCANALVPSALRIVRIMYSVIGLQRGASNEVVGCGSANRDEFRQGTSPHSRASSYALIRFHQAAIMQ
jgi:hypothetical protein